MVKRRFSSSSGLVGRDVAIDLGTANTLVYVRGEGILINEPSVVAVTNEGVPLAVGSEAKRMLGRTPAHIQAIRPLKDGVIANFDICEKMLRYFIQRVSPGRFIRPRMVICVPSGITPVEQRAVQEAAISAGAKKPVYIIEEPMAAAIGAGLPVQEASGSMIVDIGGGYHRGGHDLAGRGGHRSVDPHGRRSDGRRHHCLPEEGAQPHYRQPHG